ncbi:hypothetical protein DPMN_094788 [Dreissena polymorpha]|uniref:Uncharacterized protein n=1 Tax=Dreissena polymorpha TaxID=45954 RepID=A0A9D4R3V0_DREPO|nr:hypothetical protein DPMN_094788 [Dreissena polymorpha]
MQSFVRDDRMLQQMEKKSWPLSLPKVRHARLLCCHLHCPRPSSGDVVKPLSTYGQLPFRLAILPNSGSQRSQQERKSGSRDDGTRLINRAAEEVPISDPPQAM